MSKKNVKISVITASKNCAHDLEVTALSLERQTFQDFEWLLCDSESSDDSREVFLNSNIVNKKIVSYKDNGIGDAWNKGITFAEGDYVCFLNAGDSYNTDFFAIAEKFMPSCKVITASAILVGSDGSKRKIFRSEPHKLRFGMYIPHNWMLVSNRLIEKTGPFQNFPYSMDYEWALRLFDKIKLNEIKIISEPMGFYTLGGLSDKYFVASFLLNKQIMNQFGFNKFRNTYICYLNIFKHFLKYRLLSWLH